MKIKLTIPVLHEVETQNLPEIRLVRTSFELPKARAHDFEKIFEFSPSKNSPLNKYTFFRHNTTCDLFMFNSTKDGDTIIKESINRNIIGPQFFEMMQLDPQSHNQVVFSKTLNHQEIMLSSPSDWFMAQSLFKRDMSNKQEEKIRDMKDRIQSEIDKYFYDLDGNIIGKTGDPIFYLNFNSPDIVGLTNYTAEFKIIKDGHHLKHLREERTNFEDNVLLVGLSDLKKISACDEKDTSEYGLKADKIKKAMKSKFHEFREYTTKESILTSELYVIARDFIKTVPFDLHESDILNEEQKIWLKAYRQKAFDLNECLQKAHSETETLADIKDLFEARRQELEEMIDQYSRFAQELGHTLSKEQKQSVFYRQYKNRYRTCEFYERTSAMISQLFPVNISAFKI